MKKTLFAFCMISMSAVSMTKAAWYDSTEMKGDFRYRHEVIEKEGKTDRTRQRIRVRFGFYGDINEEVSYGIRLASGSSDPTSSNQTLDGAGSSKGINLDRAYITYKPASINGLGLTLGKMGQAWEAVADLVWDGDFNPEGISARYSIGDEKLKANLQAGGFWIDERSSDSHDALLYTAQFAITLTPSEKASLVAGASYYGFENLEGYEFLSDPDKTFGNSSTSIVTGLDDDGNPLSQKVYANDYREIEGFVAANLDLGLPVQLTGQYVVNTDADEQDTAYLLGISAGDTKGNIPVKIGYSFRDIEKDAVVGALTDSDFVGGGSNGAGHKFSLTVGLLKNYTFGATYLMTQIDPDGQDLDYKRLMIDIAGKF